MPSLGLVVIDEDTHEVYLSGLNSRAAKRIKQKDPDAVVADGIYNALTELPPILPKTKGRTKSAPKVSKPTPNLPATTEPKFKRGDPVNYMNGETVLWSGHVWAVGEYDDYVEQWRYKVMRTDDGSRFKLWINENSLRAVRQN